MDDQNREPRETDYGIAPPGPRLPAGTHPGRVRLQVADLERSLDYYERVLGFRALDRSDGAATLGSTDDDAPLVELRERVGAEPVPRRGRLGLYHYAVLLPDRAALGRFVRHLGEVGVRPGAANHRVSEALYLDDPDGLGVEVYADRPRSTWRYDGRQVVMATEPLDLESVVAAAGDEPWTGMPRGTTIGHVHLHVGDLEAADAFYHRDLGLTKTVWSYPGALFLAVGGYHHHLGLNTWVAGAAAAGADDARLLEWELLVPSPADARETLERVKATGHRVEQVPDGGIVRDPWGTALRVRVG